MNADLRGNGLIAIVEYKRNIVAPRIFYAQEVYHFLIKPNKSGCKALGGMK
jgi:hypothetical protein